MTPDTNHAPQQEADLMAQFWGWADDAEYQAWVDKQEREYNEDNRAKPNNFLTTRTDQQETF